MTTGDPQARAIGEIVTWLEQQIRLARDDNVKSVAQVDQIRRQVHDLADQLDKVEQTTYQIDPKLQPFKFVPEKLRSIDEHVEQIRQHAATNKAETDNALRLLRAESEYDRHERAETAKRIEMATTQLGLLLADISQVQGQASQISQSAQSLIERQREVEGRTEQYGLRLDRAIEVNRDLEERIYARLTEDQDKRFAVVYERLQVVGEMVKRNEEIISALGRERALQLDVINEVRLWREEHTRIDSRLNAIEEVGDRLLSQVEKVHSEVTVLEGRHAGLGERVGGIRKDIAEIVDQVKAEFAKYNQMTENQRRKQIQVLEQELREMKFHAFRPPEEP